MRLSSQMRKSFIPDASFINDFRKCPELARCKAHLGATLDLLEEAPHAGTCWHAGLFTWFAEPASNFEAARDSLREAWGEEPLFPVKPLKRPLAHIEAMLHAYTERWPREDDPFGVVQNEEYFKTQIAHHPVAGFVTDEAVRTNPDISIEETILFQYCGIKDRKIRFEDGSEYVMDAKMTGSYLNDSYYASYQLSQQMRGYVAHELVCGRRCDGAYLDTAQIDTRYHKIKPEHFDRRQVKYPQWKLDAWAKDTERAIQQWQKMVDEIGITQRWEQREQGCWSWGRPCPMWKRCNVPEEVALTLPDYRYGQFWEPSKRARATAPTEPEAA